MKRIGLRDQRNAEAFGEENAERLLDGRVAVVGSGSLGQLVMGSLAGLGVRGMYSVDDAVVLGNELEPLVLEKEKNASKVEVIGRSVRKINEDAELKISCGRFQEWQIRSYSPQVVVDASNDPMKKLRCFDYCVDYRVPFISGSTDRYKGRMVVFRPFSRLVDPGLRSRMIRSGFFFKNELTLDAYVGKEQSGVPSGVVAGLIVDQVKRVLLNEERGDIFEEINYNLYSRKRFGRNDSIVNCFSDYSKYTAVVVGAGALGNFVGMQLALLGWGKVLIYDDDRIEAHNRNRQMMFHSGNEGEMKSRVLSERMRAINANVAVEGYEKRFVLGDGFSGADLVFSCVDTARTRYEISKQALQDEVPVVDGGTTARNGRISIFVPGETSCLNCQNNFKEMADRREKAEQKRLREGGCLYAERSVVVPNIIIGSAMVGEGLKIVYSGKQKGILEGNFFYESTRKDRPFYLGPRIKLGTEECICLD
ncbi:hypothetical protein CMO92_02645 [Candidatus Woesearchaeota archaeon]|nr:hypothetical protein [Candidatus Woesearchaeota archaeon]|tara:strand:- start:1480 stop:2916 length:1437 start_codon:yes stop_codon:yes gene_type:complete